jgi:hypothetical protein
VNHDSDLRRRLEQLERLLVEHRPSFRDDTGDEVESTAARIDAVLQRLRQLTTAMQRRNADINDPLDRVTMRLMLEDYAAALSHLRASIRHAEHLLSSVAKTVTDAQRFVRLETKRRSR